MKKIILPVLFIISVSIHTFSQNGQLPSKGGNSGGNNSGPKWATNGNNLSVNDRLGSNNNQDLNFYTNSVKRGSFTKDGQFNALYNAHVEGIFTIGNTLTFNGSTNTISSSSGTLNFGTTNLSTGGTITASTLNVSGQMQFDSIKVLTRARFGNSIVIDQPNNNIYTDAIAPTDLLIQSNPAFNNNTIINANNTGNVGIGITGPGAKLHVTATGGTSGIITTSAGGNGITATVANGGNAVVGAASGGNGGVFSSTSGFGLIVTSGNAGLGTATPSQKLEVAHNDLNGGIALNRLSGTTAKSEIKFNQNGVQKWALGNDLGSNGTSDFFIWDHAAQATRFFISSAGSVGIGTTTPDPNCKVSIETSTNIGLCSKTNHSAPYGYNILAIANNTRTKAIAVIDQNGQDQFFVYGDGLVAAREFKVTVGQFPPDYVFEDGYPQMPIHEYRRRIRKGGHFPEMLSGKQMQREGYVAVGDFQFRLLKIQEHQILYTFNHEDRIAELEKQNTEKDKKMAELEKKMDQLLNSKK